MYQFNRTTRLVLSNAEESLEVEELTVYFDIQKTLLGYPARGRIVVYNLSEENIQRITKRYTSVELYGGYVGNESLLFRGNITNYYKDQSGPTGMFVLIVKSSTSAWEESTFTRTYKAGTPPSTIINEVAASFKGVITGQIMTNPDWEPSLADVTVMGSSRRIMDQLARDYNFDWNIVEDEVIAVPRGQTLQDQPLYVIDSNHGLIGIPVITDLGVDFRILLNPAIMLGRQVELRGVQSVQLGQQGTDFRKVRNTADGVYKVMDIRQSGSKRDVDWYYDIVAWGTNSETRN
jgi:hypothetical protein